MRITDLDFILVPEWLAHPGADTPDADHWISRWQRNIRTADWLDGQDPSPSQALRAQCAKNARPTVIVTHGSGVNVLLDSGDGLGQTAVAGAFIVAPVPSGSLLDATGENALRLGFPSVVIASDDHPELSEDAARQFSARLGSHFVAAGPSGRLDAASGQGPWPEGLMRLGWFLKRLSAH
ncbi:MAG: RBBP9/YdeN family alpha/beta hydrolase [Hyphomicrobiaceae bacterium]